MIRRLRRSANPTGALLAIAALAITLAATATALPGRNTVNSGDIKPNAVKRSDQAQNQRTEWAIVNLDDGTIIRQSGGISLNASGDSYAYVNFGHSVRSRALYARDLLPLGSPVLVTAVLCGPLPQGTGCDDPQPDDNTAVYIQTEDANSRVYLAVLPK